MSPPPDERDNRLPTNPASSERHSSDDPEQLWDSWLENYPRGGGGNDRHSPVPDNWPNSSTHEVDDSDEEEHEEDEDDGEDYYDMPDFMDTVDDDDDEDNAPLQDLFGDVEGGLNNITIEFTMAPADNNEPAGDNPDRVARISPSQILQLLGANGLRQILESHGVIASGLNAPEDNDDDDEEDMVGLPYGYRFRRRRRNRPVADVYPKVPSEVGRELMGSGQYGSNPHYVDELKKRKKRLATKLMWRELGIGTTGAQKRDSRAIFQDMIPSSQADKIIHYDSRCYSGQFSDDGNFFFCCSQDFKVRMYDTSNPFEWKYYKTVDYPFGRWTITDATLSPDNKYLAYSSIRYLVSLAPTDPTADSDPVLLDFSNTRRGRSARHYGSTHMGIWSIRFSGDGREIVAGTSDRSVIVYDIETRQSVLRLTNHQDDVNAVCFGDTSSPHILYSGSDDTTLRVWDRRSMSDRREAGAFIGHTEGLTYVDSKGDGRYVLSNGKDQLMKLWDLRKMMTTADFDKLDINKFTSGFDYRFMPYQEEEYVPHPHDCSVVTFRGHSVLKTLIRCHFSPPGSTNSRYVYSGSEDGKVYVYNLDATLAGTIDVRAATEGSRPFDHELVSTYDMRGSNSEMQWRTCVRDASWHPSAPVLAATSWNGWGMSTGTCTIHTWNDSATDDEGSPRMGLGYDSKLREIPEFNQYKYGPPGTRRRCPRTSARHA